MEKHERQKVSTLNRNIFATLTAILIVFALMITLVTSVLFNKSIESALDTDINYAHQVTDMVEDHFNSLAQFLILIQLSLQDVDLHSADAAVLAERIMTNVLESNQNIYSVWFIPEEGVSNKKASNIIEYYRKDGTITQGYSQRTETIKENQDLAPWFFRPLTTGEPYYGIAEYYDYGTGEGSVSAETLSAPIRVDGRIIGVCGFDILNHDTFVSIIHDVHKEQRRVIHILSQDMTILHGYNHEFNGKNLADFPDYSVEIENIRNALKHGNTYTNEIFSPFLGEKVFEYYQPVYLDEGELQDPLYIQISTPLKEIFSHAYNTMFLLIIASIACMLIFIGIIFFTAYRILRPIRVLTQRARQVAAGDFTIDIFDFSDKDPYYNSEIKTLQSALMNMLHMLNDNLQTVEKRVEERTRDLHRSYNYIKRLIEHTSTITILLDGETNITFCNNKILDLLQITDISEIVGMPLLAAQEATGDEEYIKRCYLRISRISSGEEDMFVEDEVINWPNGESCLYRITYKRVLDEGGKLEGIVVVMRDLTDIWLEEGEHRINDMLTSAAMPCQIWDETGRIVAFNREAASTFGAAEDLSTDGYNRFFFSIQPENQPDGNKSETMRRAVIDEALGKGFAQVRVWLNKEDGTAVCFTVNITRISWLFDYRLVVYYYDQTEIMAKEAEAREAEERIRLMFDAAPFGSIYMDNSFGIIDCNSELIRIFGAPDKRAIVEEFFRYSPEYQPDGQLSRIKASACNDEAIEKGRLVFEWMHNDYNGEPVPTEITLIRVKHGDRSIAVGYVRDLREIKANEQKVLESLERERQEKIQREAAQAASNAKTTFLAKMSHEIRTPMNSIMGFTELALDHTASSQVKEYLDRIMDSTNWLLGIINDILDISEIESGRMEIKKAPFDLQNVFQRCQSAIMPHITEKGLVLKVSMEPLANKWLLGDAFKLYQTIFNLLLNAVKFTDSGTVMLSSSVIKAGARAVTIQFIVKDSGIGMDSDQIENIFDLFMQADSGTTRNHGGTGLGLPIAKNMVELMGGKLAVESEPGLGSAFSFELTFETLDAFVGVPEDTGNVKVEKPNFAGLILVCEDNPMNQHVLCEHLERVGLQAVVANNGKIGVELVQERLQKGQKPFDIIFMDMFMPVMDGVEAARRIAALDVGTPIVAITANVMRDDVDEYKKSGMDYLSKPFSTQELWSCLLRHLTPVSVSVIDEIDQKHENDALQQDLRLRFVKDNINKYKDITESIASGDIMLAHRLAHTIKGNAGQIGKTALQSAAAEVETVLKDGLIPTARQIGSLGTELNIVLEELKPLLDESIARSGVESLTNEQALALFERLEPMLENINPECAFLLDEILRVPGAEELARRIEDYDFAAAAEILADLRSKRM